MTEALSPEVLDNIKAFSGSEPSQAKDVILSGGTMVQTKTGFVTAVAVQKKRDFQTFVDNALVESKWAGSNFYYKWPVKTKDGAKTVQGPSIDLAMCLARHYGNCAIPTTCNETASHYIFEATFIDLESGFSISRAYKQRKNQNTGMKDGDRADDMVFQIGQSKAQRNAIIKAMPGWLIDKAVEVAEQAEIASIKPENIHMARAKVVEFFSGYGVTREMIEAKLEMKADQWTPAHISDLRAMAKSVKDGYPINDIFPKQEKEKPTEPEKQPVEPKTENKQKTKETEKHVPQKEEDMNEFEMFMIIARKDAPETLKRAMTVHGITDSDIKNLRDPQKEALIETYNKLEMK